METFLTHFQTHTKEYIVIGVCMIPIIAVTRKYSVPAILYTIEYAIYLLMMHTVVYCVLNVARWFKTQSSMKALRADGTPADAPDWTIPYVEFWKTHEYKPEWVWKMEIVVAILIFAAMVRYRPMKVQSKRLRRYNDTGKKRTDFSKYNPRNRRNAPPTPGGRH